MAYSSKYWRLDLGMQAAQTDGDQLSEVAFFDGSGAAISLTGATVTASSTGAATNLCPNSIASGSTWGGTTVTANAAAAPDGTLTAGKAVVNGSASGITSTHYLNPAVAQYTISVWLRADVEINITPSAIWDNSSGTQMVVPHPVTVTTQWQRFVLPATTTQTGAKGIYWQINLSSGQTVYFWGTQIEVGSTASAYVPQPGGVASGGPSVLTDGSTSTWWYPGALAAGGTASLYLTFPAAVDVGSIQFTQGNNLFEGPASTAIYTSPDGSTWTKVASANFAAWSGTTPQTVILTEAEISQLGAQALTVNNPEAEIFQFGAQALTVNDPAAEISQLGAQALTVNNPAARIFQAGLLAFVQYYPPYQVFQLGAEALTINDPQAQIGQLGAQALTINEPDAQVFQLGLMAFVRYVPAATPAPLTVTRKPGTRIDVALTYDSSLRALDTVFDGKDFVLDDTPASVLLGSLLVDRRAHPDDTWPPAVPDWANPSSLSARKGWVGDALDQHGLLVGSRLWELDRRLAEEQTRSDCQDYLVEAVQPLESQRGYAIKIQVAWEMPQILGYSVTVGSTTIQLKKALS